MKMINDDTHDSLKRVSLFLTPKEAKQMRDELNRLLENPEAKEHFHLYSEGHMREISCSIITESKLKEIKMYNKYERQVLQEK